MLARRAFALALLVAAGCGSDAPPHLVWITADTLRADHTSLLGYARDTTPHLAALARDGLHYRQAITLVPKTGPSFASHVTGLPPEVHGVTSNRFALPEGATTVAERLAEAGYATAAFVANPILAPRKGFARGFDRYEEFGKQGSLRPQLRAVLDWAEGHDWSRPTFLWVHFIDPHGPYTPPPELRERFVGDASFEAETRRVPLEYTLPEGVPENRVLGALPRYQRQGDEDRVAWYVSQYDAEIVAMDRALGELLDFLRARDLYDGAGIVFTSDHGESLGEHDYYFEHGWYVYDATLRVPLVVKPPASALGDAPGTSDVQVTNLDTAPTLLAMAGVDVPPVLRGRDLRSEPGRRAARVSNPSTYPERYVAVRTPEAKYVRALGSGAEETYRLDRDPGEEHDVTSEAPELVERLRRAWDRLGAGRDDGGASPRELEPTPEERRQLEHLGYVGGGGAAAPPEPADGASSHRD